MTNRSRHPLARNDFLVHTTTIQITKRTNNVIKLCTIVSVNCNCGSADVLYMPLLMTKTYLSQWHF